MNTDQKQTLLDAYGQAMADATMLNVIIQALAASNDTPPGMDATIIRSINRAEKEMHEIRKQYEEGA